MIRTDKYGNRLMIHQSGVMLKLKIEKREKEIFKIEGSTVSKYIAKRNIFKKDNSIGFNYSALKLLKDRLKIHHIIIRVGKNSPTKLKIQDILNDGKFMHFLKGGFELQIFYPLEKLYD